MITARSVRDVLVGLSVEGPGSGSALSLNTSAAGKSCPFFTHSLKYLTAFLKFSSSFKYKDVSGHTVRYDVIYSPSLLHV